MAYSIREADSRDSQYVHDIDVKSYQYPWTLEEWIENADRVYVACWFKQPIGFVVFAEPENGIITLKRLAVKPNHRNRGVGTLLMAYVEEFAKYYVAKIKVLVPETAAYGDVGHWLLRLGFKAKRVVLNSIFNCGEYEDGVEFLN